MQLGLILSLRFCYDLPLTRGDHMSNASTVQRETLFGHPVGLYTLFFAEMWERFSYYGMRALLVLYMIKGFLSYSDDKAYGIYGAYCGLVYVTGFVGGMLADHVLGTRRSVVLGGLLMAAGHLMMTIESTSAFYMALALLVVGNGFFKPNISTTVGTLYPPGSPKKDSGFTIFYMGINLGAALSPILCAYIADKYGWHYGFGLATIGMLIGLAVFVAPIRITQVLILLGAFGTALGMLVAQKSTAELLVNLFVALALVSAAIIAFVALGRGGLPAEAGAPPDPDRLRRKVGVVRLDVLIYIGALLSVPLFALLMQRDSLSQQILYGSGIVSLAYLLFEGARRTKVERERMFVIIILAFFSIVFWASFEQAGSSMGNFADRNVDRVSEEKNETQSDIGKTIQFRISNSPKSQELVSLPRISQEQLGKQNDDPAMAGKIAEAIRLVNASKPAEKQLSQKELDDFIARATESKTFVLTSLDSLRDAAVLKDAPASLQTLDWKIAPDNVGMGIGGSEVATPALQSANAIYILVFGLVFTALWSFLAARGLEPSIPVKFALALVQLGLGFGVLWYASYYAADERGLVALPWLLLAILLHTTGELCTSPIGLSMVSNLSPRLLVSTVMGAWWVGMGIANALSSVIAAMTGIEGEAQSGPQVIPVPGRTLHIYGDVFGKIAIMAFVAAVACFLISPLLTRWMHNEAGQT
jgi:POT family proton-dependent oligopeptide transporter